MYQKILVPLDGSDLAEAALPYAEEIVGRLGSEIILLHVSESTEYHHYHSGQLHIDRVLEATKHGAERYLEQPAQKAIKVEPAILVGNPAEEIINYADKQNIDLIIMATHGRSGIGRWALGSVADKVVRATKRPVALIRAKGARSDVREEGILNRALVPLDGSKEGETVLPYIGELASRLKAEVVLLRVISPDLHVYAGGDGVIQVPYDEGKMVSLTATAKGYLNKVADRLKGKSINARSEVRIGPAGGEIIKLADEIHADVVAMSTHGRSGVSRWVLGSVTDKVLRGGNTPLLLVRVPGAITE